MIIKINRQKIKQTIDVCEAQEFARFCLTTTRLWVRSDEQKSLQLSSDAFEEVSDQFSPLLSLTNSKYFFKKFMPPKKLNLGTQNTTFACIKYSQLSLLDHQCSNTIARSLYDYQVLACIPK